jgi:hypothetical protein
MMLFSSLNGVAARCLKKGSARQCDQRNEMLLSVEIGL